MEPSKPSAEEQAPTVGEDNIPTPISATAESSPSGTSAAAEPVVTAAEPESPAASVEAKVETPPSAVEAKLESPPTPAGPTLEERQQRQQWLQNGRTPLLAMLVASQRSKPAALAEAIGAYLQTVQGFPEVAADEWNQIRTLLAEQWDSIRSEDQVKWTQVEAEGRLQQAGYVALFESLVTLEQAVAGEIASMDNSQETFLNAPQELRDSLLNYRKGIEIIQRMLKRVLDRRKPLSAEVPSLPSGPGVIEVAPELEQWSATLTQIGQQHHDWRTASVNLLNDARKPSDNIKKETLQLVKNLVGALDGVENGLRSEPDLLALLQPFKPEYEALIDSWMQAYHRLEQVLQPFYAATGLKPITVERGTPFQPETMEPGGTVSDPQLKNEDVAAVLRRGYSYNGEFIRPLLVEVVVNPASQTKE